jgi:oligoribonuclease (3'-5' exoribonuclease)
MGKRIKEYYISVDVEADGPCPGVNNMLQFGAVFYDSNGNVLDEYLANILPIEGAVADPGTMNWWSEQEAKRPGLWASMMENRVDAKTAMEGFRAKVNKWSGALRASPLVVAYPAGFDFTFAYYYQCRFLGSSCVGFSALDMKTMAMCLLNRTYHDSAKRRFPREWFNPKFSHTHNALDDARGQGYTFFKMVEAFDVLYHYLEPTWPGFKNFPKADEE